MNLTNLVSPKQVRSLESHPSIRTRLECLSHTSPMRDSKYCRHHQQEEAGGGSLGSMVYSFFD